MSGRNTANREERILSAAAKLIARYGYDKTTMSDIATAAGVAKGAIYLHWKSKEELFDALLKHEMLKLMNDLLLRVESDTDGGSLPHLYRHALMSMQANPLISALYTRDSQILGSYIHQQDNSRYLERFRFGRSFVETMQTAGLVRKELDADSLAYLLFVIAYGFTGIGSIVPADQAPSFDQIADVLDELFSHGAALDGGDTNAGKEIVRQSVALIHQQYHPQEGKS
jgi:AcrR family transcriptional regulator